MSHPIASAPLLSVLGFCIMLSLAGCGEARHAGSYTGDMSAVPETRDIAASQERTTAAKKLLLGDPQQAERLLREALDLDLYNGVAHNNLGVLFLHAGKLYEAAQEFEWARKLLPGHPDPRLNLAVALQQAEKSRDALDAARSALEVQPGYLPAIQAVAAIQVDADLIDEKTPDLLASITERCQEPAWREWATQARLRIAARAEQ